MTTDDDRVEARIRAAFLSEKRRAESDLRTDPLLPQPRTRPRLVVRLAVVAVVALVAVTSVGIAAELAVQPSATPRLGASTSAGSTQPGGSASPDLAGHYLDGIPATWQGQKVFRWAGAVARGTTVGDDSPFYVAAWLDVNKGPRSCPLSEIFPSPTPIDMWLPSGLCGGPTLRADEGATSVDLTRLATFNFVAGDLSTGPAILRVHVHDPRAIECVERTVCDHTMVIDQAVWLGDSAANLQPYTFSDVMNATWAVIPKSWLAIADPANEPDDPRLPGALGLYALSVDSPFDMSVRAAYLMESPAAVLRALPGVQPGADGALLPSALRSTEHQGGPGISVDYANRWLVVGNVAFSVITLPEPSAADRAWLASLEATLKATH